MSAETKKSIKGTLTEKNLVNAYLSESAAYTRYTYYAKQADKENYFPVGEIFRQTADNELHHSKVFFKYLEGGVVPAMLDVDAGTIADTATNLETAVREEQKEGVEQYMAAAKTAEEEGFDEIASHFRAIAEVEEHHSRRFGHFLKHVQDGTLWKRDYPIRWQCLVCGYIHLGTEPPEEECPACDHPRQHYMPLDCMSPDEN